MKASVTTRGISWFAKPENIHRITYNSRMAMDIVRTTKVKINEVFISVSFNKQVEPVTKLNNTVIGVDRGINDLAVTTPIQIYAYARHN